MLLTREFTFIHLPKTGGTFVTSVLERLHGVPRTRTGTFVHRFERKLGVPLDRRRRRYGELRNVLPKHATCHDIPPSHSYKPILSCMRGPHEWYVSLYEFGWWKRVFEYQVRDEPTPSGAAFEKVLPQFIEARPHFPDVSFAEFMRLCAAAADAYNDEAGTDFGLFTHEFVRFFYRDPAAVLRKLDESYVASGRHLADRFDVTFLRTEQLNSDLQSALRSLGYRDEDLAFIGSADKVLPLKIGRSADQRWQDYYSPDLAALVREKDSPLFTMFPAYAAWQPPAGRR